VPGWPAQRGFRTLPLQSDRAPNDFREIDLSRAICKDSQREDDTTVAQCPHRFFERLCSANIEHCVDTVAAPLAYLRPPVMLTTIDNESDATV
jgi:hypothetical protein